MSRKAPVCLKVEQLEQRRNPSTVYYNSGSGVVSYIADPDETNVLTVTGSTSGVNFTDPGATIVIDSESESYFSAELTDGGWVMHSTGPVTSVYIELDNLGDSANASALSGGVWVEGHGGTGNDTITSSSFADFLYGGEGDDNLNGGDDTDLIDGEEDADTVDGGAGDDTLYDGSGDDDDSVFGGDGSDTLSFDDGADTGEGGDGDDWFL